MTEQFFTHVLDNGLILLAERLDHVVSAAMNLAVPAGASRDGADHAGIAGVINEWLFRGAGGRDSRQLNDALDSLGCHHDESVHSIFVQLSSTQTNRSLAAALALYADIVQKPDFRDDMFEPCVALAQQELASLTDQPSQKCSLELRRRFYPAPLGANPLGTAEALGSLKSEICREHARRHLTPRGAMLAVAGRFEWEQLRDWVVEYFGPWQGDALTDLALSTPIRGVVQESRETAQVQIALAYPAPVITDEHYYPARVVEMILSGGMSGRLFTEVREKHGLAYSVSARYRTVTGTAGMFVYAGTTPQRAQQTLEVTVAELGKLAEGVTDQELARAKTQLKSALIMQGERTSSRAIGLVSDWDLLRRLRSLREISDAVDAVTTDHVDAFLAAWPAEGFAGYLMGPKPLDVSCLE